MKHHSPVVVGICICSLVIAAVEPAWSAEKNLPEPVPRPVVFSQDIRPIIEKSCVTCHGNGRSKGGFAMDTRETMLAGGHSGPAVVLGRSHESLLIDLVAGVDPDNVMPQKGTRLTHEQIGLLRAWIDQELPWDPGTSFARKARLNLVPRKVPVNPDPGKNPIDCILAEYFKTNSPSGSAANAQPVEDRVFARRVFLDGIGLLPTPEEIQRFENDTRSDKREQLAKNVLGRNQQYAEHWLTFWNDLLRNDYKGTGYIDGGRKQITPWLYDALLVNMPFDRFTGALINPTSDTEGFVKGIVWRGVVNASQTPAMQAAQNISQVFMGVNLKCASCHDSFINDWRLSDAYGLASIYSEGPLEMFQCDKPTGSTAHARFIYPELGEIDPAADRATRLERLEGMVTGPQDGRLSRTIVNRLWAKFFGHGLVEPVDDMEKPAWCPDLLDWLAEDLVANGYDLKLTMERIFTSQAYQMASVNLGEEPDNKYVFSGPAVRRLTAEQFRDAIAQLTGVWHTKADFGGKTNGVRASLVAADPLAVALGRPNREQVATVRPSIATTLQALELTNGETLARVLETGAAKLAESDHLPDELVNRLFVAAYGRDPRATEKELSLRLLGDPISKQGLEDLLWAVAMLPEFQLIY